MLKEIFKHLHSFQIKSLYHYELSTQLQNNISYLVNISFQFFKNILM